MRNAEEQPVEDQSLHVAARGGKGRESRRLVHLGEEQLERALPTQGEAAPEVRAELEAQLLVQGSLQQCLELALEGAARDHQAQLDAVVRPAHVARFARSEGRGLTGACVRNVPSAPPRHCRASQGQVDVEVLGDGGRQAHLPAVGQAACCEGAHAQAGEPHVERPWPAGELDPVGQVQLRDGCLRALCVSCAPVHRWFLERQPAEVAQAHAFGRAGVSF